MRSDLPTVNIGNIADGALVEVFDLKLAEVMKNIMDPSTPLNAKRKLTLELTFKPFPDRKGASISFQARTALATIEPHQSQVYMAKDEAGHIHGFAEDPRQQPLFRAEEPPQNVVNMAAGSPAK